MSLTRQLGITLAGVRPELSTGAQQWEETLSIVHRARDAGFGYVVLGQHFLASPLQYLHAIPTLARLAPESGDMKLLVGIMLLSMVNPVDAADQLATLDVISGGRLVLGVGMGYRDVEFEAFGVDRADRGPRMREALEVVRKLWAGGPVHHDGKFFHVHADGASLRPHQRPEPPIWMAAMAPKTLERAVSLGLVPYMGPAVPMKDVASWVNNYRAQSGNPRGCLPVRRDVFVVPDRRKAWEIASRFVEEKYIMYQQQGFDSTIGQDGDMQRAIRERVIVGDVAECSDALAAYFEMGAAPLILRCQWPSLQTSEVERMIDDVARAAESIKSVEETAS